MSVRFKASDLGRSRTRALGADYPTVMGTERFYLFGNLYQTTIVGGHKMLGYERTDDATHPWFIILNHMKWQVREGLFRNLLFKHVLKTGGGFKSEKKEFLSAPQKISIGTTGGNRTLYDGYILPVDPAIVASAPAPISDLSLMDLGAKQIAYNKPNKPLVSIGQDIGEMKKDGLPSFHFLSMLKERTPDSVGSDYLNYQFGWKPIISDVYKLAHSINKADKAWRDLKADAGKLQRRHYEFPIDQSITTTTVTPTGTVYPTLPTTLCSNQSGPLIRERALITRMRFSAAYVYAMPDIAPHVSDAVKTALRYQQQYGLEIDPELLWNLSPWSWFIDWFVPVGDFVTAANSYVLGNTALPWAYMSVHTMCTDTYTRPSAILIGGGSVGSLIVRNDYKRRIPASPFGFNLSWSNFSPWQLSILAALGVSR